MPKTKVIILLAVIAALGAALRFYGIERESLSGDELSSWKRSSYADLATVIEEGVRTDVHPPAYQLLLYFVRRAFGESELALRFPSAIFGVLSIVFIFLLALMIYSRREAVLSAALMAVLWCPVFYSQDARPYAMLLFLTVLSSYFWVRMYQTLTRDARPRHRALIGYAVSAAICAYTHYFGTLLIALQGIFTIMLFMRRRRALLSVAFVYLAVAVSFLPWLAVTREQFARGPVWIPAPRAGPVAGFLDYLTFISNRSGAVRDIALGLLLLLFARTYGEFTLQPTWRQMKRMLSSPGAALALWLIVPFAAAYLVSRSSTPVLTNRNLIISLPAFCLLCSRSVTRLPVRPSVHWIVICLASALLTYQLIGPTAYYSRIEKDQFRDAVRYLLDDGRINRCPLVVANTNQEGYFDYYFNRLGSLRRVDVYFRSEEDWERVRRAIESRHAECLWYLKAATEVAQQHLKLRKFGFDLENREPFLNVEVREYRRRTAGRNTSKPEGTKSGAERRTAPAGLLWETAMKQPLPEEKIRVYREIVSTYPNDPYAPQALFMIGYVYAEEIKEPIQARRALEELILRYPESSLVGSARLMIDELNGTRSEHEVINNQGVRPGREPPKSPRQPKGEE